MSNELDKTIKKIMIDIDIYNAYSEDIIDNYFYNLKTGIVNKNAMSFNKPSIQYSTDPYRTLIKNLLYFQSHNKQSIDECDIDELLMLLEINCLCINKDTYITMDDLIFYNRYATNIYNVFLNKYKTYLDEYKTIDCNVCTYTHDEKNDDWCDMCSYGSKNQIILRMKEYIKTQLHI